MGDLYKNDNMLFYLRTHPEWYKILHRFPHLYKDFLNTAKEEMKLTLSDKIGRFGNQIQLLSLISEYMKR